MTGSMNPPSKVQGEKMERDKESGYRTAGASGGSQERTRMYRRSRTVLG